MMEFLHNRSTLMPSGLALRLYLKRLVIMLFNSNSWHSIHCWNPTKAWAPQRCGSHFSLSPSMHPDLVMTGRYPTPEFGSIWAERWRGVERRSSSCRSILLQEDLEVGEMHFSLDSNIAGGGGNLSIGERQIIALARAMVRGSKLLILDEGKQLIESNEIFGL